jgi:hypothetical protein
MLRYIISTDFDYDLSLVTKNNMCMMFLCAFVAYILEHEPMVYE